MSRKKIVIIVIAVLAVAAAVSLMALRRPGNGSGAVTREVTVRRGEIRATITTTGTVLPKNRLEVKPPINGRVEEMLVKEGESVEAGKVLAWMSSTERAALLDAARGQSEEALAYWKDTYKAIPIVSPIRGEVIVATMQAGQTVTTSDAIVVLSDHLICRAQIDETDIGKIKEGQQAVITLDAYPETKIPGTVEHIYYESKTVNNVTIYEADVIPEEVPPFFRSGMNASVDFKVSEKADALLLPQDAVERGKDGVSAMIKTQNGVVRKPVVLGLSDDKHVEIVSGLDEGDVVVFSSKKYALPKQSKTGTNPFMPNMRRR